MKTLEQQLIDYGFHPSFKPTLTDSWIEVRDENLGKVSYKYREYNSSKGVIKNFTFSYWKAGDTGITFTENPEKITQKELKDFHKKDKEFEAELQIQKEVEEAIIAAESVQFVAECIPLITGNDYLKLKGFSEPPTEILRHKDNVDTIIVPIYDEKNTLTSWQEIYHDGQKHIKRGSKIRGCFAIIRSKKEGNGSFLYYAEGFATGLTIHKATGCDVACTLSSSNFSAAARNIHKLFKDKYRYHVICADDDRHNPRNPGIVAAKTAAKEIRGFFKSPRFSTLDGKNTTDFNDLMMREGLGVVKAQLELTKEELEKEEKSAALYYLGYDRQNNFYVSSKENHNIIALTDITQQNLTSLMPLSYWRDNFGTVTKTGEQIIDWLQVASDIKEKCRLKGNYDEKEQLGIGIYRDEGRIVVNTGRSIIVDGEELNLRQIDSRHIYIQDTPIENFLNYPALTQEQANNIIDLFNTLVLEEKDAAVKFLLGWCVSSILSGITTWRSHLYVTGERGSGKSTILKNILSPLLSAFNAREGTLMTSTGVGASQFIAGYSGPVLMDEAETESKRAQDNIKTFLETCRAASSKGERLKGTPSKGVIRERYAFSAMFMSIIPSIKETADISRFTLIRVGKGSQEQFETLKRKLPLLEEAGVSQAFIHRIYKNINTILANIETAKQIIAENIGDMRTAEQFGTILGSYYVMEHEGLLTESDKATIKNISLSCVKMTESSEHDSAQDALIAILDTQVLDADRKQRRMGDLIQEDMGEENKDILASLGIIPCKKNEQKGILIRQTKHMSKMMEGTKFLGNAMEILKTIPGALHGNKSVTRHKQQVFKGVWVPLAGVFEPMTDKDRIEKFKEERF